MDYIVREYLVHSGYQESFNAMDVDDEEEKSNPHIEHMNGSFNLNNSFKKE